MASDYDQPSLAWALHMLDSDPVSVDNSQELIQGLRAAWATS